MQDLPATRPMTGHRQHLFAFFSYSWACEVFSLVSGAVFIPMLLEQLARWHGFWGPHHTTSCQLAPPSDAKIFTPSCNVKIVGIWVETASFSLAVKSLTVGVQALSVISISALADVSYYRKHLLLAFAWTGSFAAILHIFLPSTKQSSIYLVAILSITAVASFGNSFVCLNAYMGQLVQEDPEIATLRYSIIQAEAEEPQHSAQEITDDEELPFATDSHFHVDSDRTANRISSSQSTLDALISVKITQISALGIAIGYAAGVAVLALSSIPVSKSGGSLDVLQGVIGFSGAWWAIFTIPAALWLPTQYTPTRILPTRVDIAEHDELCGTHLVRNKIREGWDRVGLLLNRRELRRLSQCYWFLVAWALLADAFNTTTSVAILFAKTTLQMSSSKTIVVGVLTQSTAIWSASLTPFVQKRSGSSAKALLIFSIVGVAIMCIWGLAALHSEREMYIAAVWFGMMFGPFNALSRSVFAELIPPHSNARFFSLFSITDKGASWLGPAAVAIIADRTGDIRNGFWFLLFLLLLPLPILLKRVDMVKGRKQGIAYIADEPTVSSCS